MSLYAVMNAVSSPEESASRRSEILTALHHNDGLPDCGKVDSRSVDRLVYSIASTTMKDPTKSESILIAEEQLRKVTIGEPNVVNSTIAIVDYDPVWPVLFEEEARRIRAALGERVLRVEHVGSTSVCRLAAKPIIGVVLVVADAADEAAYAPALEASGYILRIREPDWYQHRMFRGPEAAICALLITPASLVARDQVNTVPQGSVVSVRMIDSISSDQNHAGETFRASIADAIRIGNHTVVPRGANAFVKLVNASSAGRVKGRSELELQLERIVVGNQSYPVASNVVAFRGKSESKKTAKNAGIGALAGGGLGALFGGGKGAAIGAGVGAGAGVATNAAKKGEQVRIG